MSSSNNSSSNAVPASSTQGGTSQTATSTFSIANVPVASANWTLPVSQTAPGTVMPTRVANTTLVVTPWFNGQSLTPLAVVATILEYPVATTTGVESTFTSSASRCPQSSPSGTSSGTIAGAAVGCLVGGLLIGAIVAFAFLRRKHRKDDNDVKKETPVLATESKGYRGPGSSQLSNDIDLGQFLLDAAPDKEIADEFHSLSELVRSHVENHYHLQPLQGSASSLIQSIRNLGLPQTTDSTPENVAAICANPISRQAGLQHVLSTVILNSVDFHSGSRFSMLPEPVSNFLRSIPGDSQHEHSGAKLLALTQWRKLSVFLLHPSRNQRTPLYMAESTAAQQAADLVAALHSFLQPFLLADQARQKEQTDHLQAVISECARFGWLIMSQPSNWHFTYGLSQENSGIRMLVIFPGLDKLGGKDGKMYRSPHQIVAPVVAQI
ncbi:hypothetical protein Landi51_11264 [Colletotrichum acutatum]